MHLLFIGLSSLDAIDVFISTDGYDQINCGSFENPCKTLGYGFKNNGNISTIILDGGHSKQMVYYVNRTISIQTNITIRRSERSKFTPIIGKHTLDKSTIIYAFSLEKISTKINVSFHFIQFENLNIVSCKNVSCAITMHNCRSSLWTLNHISRTEALLSINSKYSLLTRLFLVTFFRHSKL